MSDRYYPTKEENIQSIYMEYFQELQNCFYNKGTLFVSREKFQKEIIPLMYVISDIAVINTMGYENREMISVLFKVWNKRFVISLSNTDNIFNNRVDLYAKFMRGKKPRYEWMFFEKPKGEDNGILRCCAAFGDILFNPDCSKNYDNAPVMTREIFKVEEFALKMRSFISVVADFYNALCKEYSSISEEDRISILSSETMQFANVMNVKAVQHKKDDRYERDDTPKLERIKKLFIAFFIAFIAFIIFLFVKYG